MRTEERWKDKLYPSILQELTPRIQKDLETIGELETMANIVDPGTPAVSRSCRLNSKLINLVAGLDNT